jgi:hypothetical protein
MTELSVRTWRAHRNLIERIRGFDRVYETEISDGVRSARGRAETREASRRAAEQNWLNQFAVEELQQG